MTIPAWIMLDARTSEAHCTRCDQRERVPLPATIDTFLKWCEYFGTRHRHCTEPKTQHSRTQYDHPAPPHPPVPRQRRTPPSACRQ